MDNGLMFKDESYAIQGAVFEVYREMGCGFLEAVYQECLEKELGKRGVPFVAQQELVLRYKGEVLKQFYRPDLVCYEKIIVELKVLSARTSITLFSAMTSLTLNLVNAICSRIPRPVFCPGIVSFSAL
jgi:GxxExxY protein